MDLTPGEYAFTCSECDGDGNVQVIIEDDGASDGCQLQWASCEDCRGTGVEHLTEEEAAERIEYSGQMPLRTPSTS